MIKRLALRSDKRRHAWEWPQHDERQAPYLLSPRKPFRQIIVMIDNELLVDPRPPRPASKAQLLSNLLQHELVRLYRYADDGPPADVAPRPEHPRLYEGWVAVAQHDAKESTWGVTFSTGQERYSLGGITGNAVDFAADHDTTNVYSDLAPRDAALRRRADALAGQVASQPLAADLYITERPYLHAATWGVARGVTVCRVDDALPLLGLYFRAQGEFPVANHFNYDRGLFYWVGTRELLPEAWRWFTACVRHASGAGDDSLELLGGSLLQRVQRALEARDATHIALNQPQDNNTQQDALSQLDVTLLNLMGAVDVAARVAHRVLGLPAKTEHRAAWQHRSPGDWLDQVRAHDGALAAVVDVGTTSDHVLTILRLLRNSVHGAALQGLTVARSGAPTESLVGLPAQDEAAVLAAMDALGGRASWAVRSTVPGRVHLDPGILVDRLLDGTVVLLNELMARTPVEQLTHVALTPPDVQPPAPAPPGRLPEAFDPWIRASIRWQLGL